MTRQGDLLIVPGTIPPGAKRVANGVVMRGEATGHNHRLLGGAVYSKGGAMFLSIADTARLVHDEHKPIVLTKGAYMVIRQREYVSADMVKVVVD